MLSNYLKVAARNWKERPLFAAINLIGLAVSFAAVLLIIQHVQFERSFDQFHNHASSIYRIGEKSATSSSASISKYLTRVPVLPALSSTYPDVESGTRVFDEYLTVQFEDRAFQFEDRAFREEITFVDSTFFNVFSFPIKGGRADQVLSEKRNVVVTTSIAQKYFGNRNPIGQAITIDHSERYVISGVVDDPPPNSSIRFDILVPFANARDRDPVKSNGTWANSFMPTYVRLDDGVSGASFESKLSPFVQSHFPDDDQDYALHLMPLTQLHAATTGNSLFLYILLCAGVVILIIAGINYTNLATAQSMIRAQEVGIRRALGAHRSQLAWQFVGESVLTSLAGLLLGVGLAHLAAPLLGSWIGVEWSLNLIGEWQKSGLLFLLALGFGLAAGLYPAMYLASNEFARSGGSAPQSQGGLRLRQGLITLQLTFSVVLIIGTFTIWGQIDFMENQDLGFTDAPVYIVQFDKDEYADPNRFTRKVATLRSVLQQEPGIAETSLSSSVPGNYTEFYQQFYPVDAPTRKATDRKSVV